jgi:tRNA(Ile)-lysidine synthase
MQKTLVQELTTRSLLHPGETVVVGVSGGPDSMALLHLLKHLARDPDWRLTLHVAHFNHRLRGTAAEEDAAFVQAAADDLSLPCTIDSRDISALADEEGGSVEEVARRERYAFFERVCIQVGAQVVAVAHHADDQAETVLHRILRGTGIRGLCGIRPSRQLSPTSPVRLIRPLLRWHRQALLDYLDDNGIPYREDETNLQNVSLRNRIRNVLLPQLEGEVNPQVRDALIRLAEQAQWHEQFLRETAHRMFETLIIGRTDQELVLNADALARKSRSVQTELVRLAYVSFGLGEQDLSFVQVRAVLDLIADSASGRQVTLPQGMSVERRYHQLIFSLPSEEPRETIAAEVAIHVPGRTMLPVRRWQIDCSVEEVSREGIEPLRQAVKETPGEECFDYDALHLPLVVRPRRPGDRFHPLGAPGTKKVSDFLTNEKVSPRERERVPMLCDRLGPVWVVGYRIDDRVKLTGRTQRVLRIRAVPLDR